MANNIYLEVSKSNGAILSYFLEQPTTPSATVDYVEATCEELIFLNALEDAIFAPGTVATVSDLSAHRTRVAAAKTKAASPTKPQATAPQQPTKAASKASNTNPTPSDDKGRQSLIQQIKTRNNYKKPQGK